MCAKSRMHGDETHELIFVKFGTPIGFRDVITPADFGGHQSMGGGVVGVKFPISLRLDRSSL